MVKRIIVVAVFIGLVIGLGIGYALFKITPQSGYWVNLQGLQDRIDDLEEQINDRDIQIATLQSQLAYLNQSHQELQADYEELNDNYSALLDTLGFIDAKNYSRTDSFNLTAVQTKSFNYDVGYGIIWEATIEFSSDYVTIIFAYNFNDTRYFVGSSGQSLSYLGYPPQTDLCGTIQVEVYDGDYPEIWIHGYVSTQFPEVDRSATELINVTS